MSKSAVDAHGVGFMKNLNRGQVQGFNSGGYVSNQGVQYKQTGGGVANSNGSSVSLDPSGLSDILNNFIGDFKLGPKRTLTLSFFKLKNFVFSAIETLAKEKKNNKTNVIVFHICNHFFL